MKQNTTTRPKTLRPSQQSLNLIRLQWLAKKDRNAEALLDRSFWPMKSEEEPPLDHHVLGLYEDKWVECYRGICPNDGEEYVDWYVATYYRSAWMECFGFEPHIEPDAWIELPPKPNLDS